MKNHNNNLTISISNTIADIPQSEWDNLFGTDLAEGRGYYKATEEGNLKEFYLNYLLIKRNHRIVGVLPLFIHDFSFTTLIQGKLQKFIKAIQKRFNRFLRIKILFVGSPITEEFHLGFAKGENLNDFIPAALNKLFEFAKSQNAKTLVFHNLKKEHRELGQILLKYGFLQMENFPNARVEIKAGSLEEYIAGLGKNTRKDLRRKLKKTESMVNLRIETFDNIDSVSEEIYSLYLNALSEGNVTFETLTPEFFRATCRNLPGVAKFFIVRDNHKIVAFNLCLVKNGICLDKIIGLDNQVSHQYHLYYLTFCHNIDWCIKNGIRFYQLGITDYEPKIRLGAKLIPLYIFGRFLNPFLNFIAKPLIKLAEPKRFDPALKKYKY